MDAYIYRGALYCESCTNEIRKAHNHVNKCLLRLSDSDDWPQGPYPDGGGEADSPQHCSCGVFLENPLTSDGIEYVRNHLQDAPFMVRIDAVRAIDDQWRTFYADALAS